MFEQTSVSAQFSKSSLGDRDTRSDVMNEPGHTFPALELPIVDRLRAEQHELVQRLFPTPMRLQRLIHDIKINFSKEIASLFGSIDFAEERLAGLIAALQELDGQILNKEFATLDEIKAQIEQDPRIHTVLEKTIYECAKHTIDEAY